MTNQETDPSGVPRPPKSEPEPFSPPEKRRGLMLKRPARKQHEDPFAGNPAFFRQIYDECEAMARFAFSSGLNLPPGLAASLEHLRIKQVNKPASADFPADQTLRRFLPPVRMLIDMHRGLSRLVAPATPRSILLLFKEQQSPLRFLGPVPLVRHMMFLSIVSLVAFVCLSLSGWVSIDNINKGLLQHSGLELLVNELFLLSAAALGASFANLFEANKYCTEGSFDPKYSSSYWVRFVLGLIAGLILAEVISSELIVSSGLDDPLAGNTGSTGSIPADAGDMAGPAAGTDFAGQGLLAQQPMIKPVLAMLGGFSSDLVFRILNRLVGGIEAMLRGDARNQIKQGKQAAKEQANMETERQRMTLAANLNGLKGKLAGGGDAADLSGDLQTLIDQLSQGIQK